MKGKKYFMKVEGYRDKNGKVKQRVLEYYGTVDPRENPDAKPIVKRRLVATYRFGDIALLYHAAEKLDMINLINKYVPKRQGLSLGLELFLTSAHRLLDDKPSSSNLSRWVKTTHLPHLLDFDPGRITDNTQQYLMSKLYDEERNIDHLFRISIDLYNAALPLFGDEEDIFFYDITSTYFEGRCCPIAFLGYSRDDAIDKLQINIGMVMNGRYGIPIITKVFEGNIHDTKTVYEMIYYAKFILKKKEGLLIMDRGMDSEDNMRLMDTVEYDYIIVLKSNHKFVENLKLKTDVSKDYWELVEHKNQTFKLKKFTKNIYGKRKTVLLYYNPCMAAVQVETRQRKIDTAVSSLKAESNLTFEKAKEIIQGSIKYFIIESTKKNGVTWRLNKIELNRAKKRDGKFCILTNMDIEAAEIFKLYFSKDKIEKGFRHMKQDGNLHPTRKRLADHVRVDVFICHLGYLLLVVAEYLVRQEKIDIFWDGITSETKEIRLVEYQDPKKKQQFQVISNNGIQQNIVDKLGLSKQLPVITTKQK
ncbi:MAG: IS1634 family transposase [Candidatus Cloacimonadia bacterium]